MKQARTIVNHLRERLHVQPPLTNLHLYIQVHYDKTLRLVSYSSDRCSPEDLAAILFDLSISGHYVRHVESSLYGWEYYIEIRLGLSEKLKTNIDASVVQEFVKIAEKARKPH